jgi:hypothetical protein
VTGKRGISAGQSRESGRASSASWRSLLRGAALEVPDDSLQACPAASTAAFNGVRIPGEKTSVNEIASPPRRPLRGVLEKSGTGAAADSDDANPPRLFGVIGDDADPGRGVQHDRV